MILLLAFLLTAGSAWGAFTAYLGDATPYAVTAIATDSSGATYVTGSHALNAQTSEVFVTKIDATGTIVFNTTFGGKGSDLARAIAVDASGAIYIGGATNSTAFPTLNALQSQPGSGFLVKLARDGSMVYSTYFGGTGPRTVVSALAVDPKGDVYLTGITASKDFPHTPGLPTAMVSATGVSTVSGAFIAKVSSAGDRIIYAGLIAGFAVSCGAGSSCFLSARETAGVAVAVDPSGAAYFTGNTNTTDLPTTAGAMLSQGIGAFVGKVNPAGSALVYLTYLGATNYVITPFSNPANKAYAIVADTAGAAYLVGATTDPQFPATAGSFQPMFAEPVQQGSPVAPPSEGFVAKLMPDGSGVAWATYLGAGGVSANSVSFDRSGNVWVAGAGSSRFPNPALGPAGFLDFLAELNPAGTALTYSSRFPQGTVSQFAALDSNGLAHIAGTGGLVSAFTQGSPPAIQIFGVANGAAGPLGGRLVPGEVFSIYGQRIGPSLGVSFTPDASGSIPTSLAGVGVTVNDVPAPLLYVSDTQINAVVPFKTAALNQARLRISFNGQAVALDGYTVAADPQIFQNPDRTAEAINEDGSINGSDSPAKIGSIVSIWVTGTGAVPAADGQIPEVAQDYKCCGVGWLSSGMSAEVLYAGAAPGIVAGVNQINFRVPAFPGAASSPGFPVPIFVTAAGASGSAQLYVTQ